MLIACILGYLAIGASFYLYITRTAEIEPDVESGSLSGTPTLTILAGGVDADTNRKAA